MIKYVTLITIVVGSNVISKIVIEGVIVIIINIISKTISNGNISRK